MLTGSPYSLTLGAATTLAMLLAFTWMQRLVAKGHSLRADVRGDGAHSVNPAYALLHAGNVAAVFLMAASVSSVCLARSDAHEVVLDDAKLLAAFGALSLVAFALSARLGVHLLFGKTFVAELERGNLAAGVAAGGHAVATGLLVARSVVGDALHEAPVALVFYALSLLAQHAFVALFRALTSYDDDDAIRDQNLAAALSYAGVSLGVAILVGRAAFGEFQGWGPSLVGFVKALGYVLLLYPARQILVEGLLLGARPRLRGGALDKAVGAERNVGAGALEAVAYVATALVLERLG